MKNKLIIIPIAMALLSTLILAMGWVFLIEDLIQEYLLEDYRWDTGSYLVYSIEAMVFLSCGLVALPAELHPRFRSQKTEDRFFKIPSDF